MLKCYAWGVSLFLFAETTLAAGIGLHARGLIVPPDADYGVPFLSRPVAAEDALPEKYDLREQGFITPVRNQGNCGSCWAFAGAAAMESALLKNQSTELNLSEQELVSCDTNSSGCRGGWQPFSYMVKKGIGLESDFPYQAKNLRCKSVPSAAKALRWGNVGSPDRLATVDEVRRAVMDFGALWISVAANSYWDNPRSGVISSCSNTKLNHAVTVAGFEPSTTAGKYRLIIKNSWGTGWGKAGYVSTALGCNALGRNVSFVVPGDHMCAPPEFGLAKKVSVGRSGNQIPVPGLEKEGREYSWYKVGRRGESKGPIVVKPNEVGDFVVKTTTECGVWSQMVQVTK